VGLAQREVERAGIATIALSNIPDLTSAVSVPRLAAIEHPFGQTMGRPGDKDTQGAVLLATLEAIWEMKTPGCIKHLPFEWTGPMKEALAQPPVAPPIAGYLKWHPWELPRLFSRDVPRI
jgi:glycine reductase complex component B subunit gamma